MFYITFSTKSNLFYLNKKYNTFPFAIKLYHKYFLHIDKEFNFIYVIINSKLYILIINKTHIY